MGLILDACLQVAKVGVHSSHLLDIQYAPDEWLKTECRKTGLDLDHPNRIIRYLMPHLHSLPPGQYMLAHQAGAPAVSCFKAAPDGTVNGQVGMSMLHAVVCFCCQLLQRLLQVWPWWNCL